MSFFQRTRQPARKPTLEDFGFVELRGGASRVLIVPALGGKIAHLGDGWATVAVGERHDAVCGA